MNRYDDYLQYLKDRNLLELAYWNVGYCKDAEFIYDVRRESQKAALSEIASD